jgi:hypothetical protein
MTTNARELAELATAYAGGNGLSFRNRLINSDMRIDQRNAGAAATIGSGTIYALDRWSVRTPTSTASTIQQSSTAPNGFKNSALITIGTGASPASDATNRVRQSIEGFNAADLEWGTANAKTVTLSFWVRSSLTGTFGGSLQNSAEDRAYPFSYSISAADTWEQKTVTIAGDTSGTWLSNNGVGISVGFSLGCGSTFLGTAGSWAGADYRGATGETNVVATTGATFYITGVQLEAGSVATPFERRPYGTELALCQRYYYRISGEAPAIYMAQGQAETTTGAVVTSYFPVTMRDRPSALEQTGTAADYRIRAVGGNITLSVPPAFNNASTYGATTSCTVASGLTAGHALSIRPNTGAAGFLAWSAEL